MGKKRTLAIILLLCVLGGLIACGRKEKEDKYTYTIKLNDNASGSKQFSSCGYLWVYSVTDQDDHSVAISNVLSIDVREDKHWYYKDGESIEFRDDYFQYRRAGEDERHDICPEYFGNILWFKLGIREVNFLPKRIVKEGEKLYLSVEIGRTKVPEMSPKYLERELLVEIDLETDTSRMLYDTRNNRTRIVGYREGNVYLLKDHIVYKNVLKTGEQREMYDLGQESMLWYEEDGEHKDVHFEWYGDYMVVWSYNNGDGENLVTIKSLDMTR